MKKFFLSLICTLLASGMLHAQFVVNGKVVEKNNAGAAYATVALLAAADSSIVKGAVTDDRGAFELAHSVQGRYLVSVHYLGFTKFLTSVFTLNNESPAHEFPQIILTEQAANLEEVTVKGQRSLVEQKGDKMILNVENSIIAKGNKVEDLLKYAPLVTNSGNGIKVGNKGNVLILIDGRQTSESVLSNFLQNFSAEEVLKVEVSSNPSARYDASYGAVINIITRKSLNVGLNGRITLVHTQGEMGRFYPDASLNYRSKKWNVFSSVSGKAEHYLEDQWMERNYPGSGMRNELRAVYKTYGISSFSGVDFSPTDKHSLGLRFNTGHPKAHYITDMKTKFTGNGGQIDSLLQIDKDRNMRSQTYDANLYYTVKLDSAGKEFSVNVTQSFLNKSDGQYLLYQRQDANAVPLGGPSRVRITNPGDQQSLIAQADLTLPSKTGKWELGTRYMSIGNNNRLVQETEMEGIFYPDAAFSNSGVYKEKGYALYSNYSNELKSGWSLQAGLRFEHTRQDLAASDLSRRYSGLFPSFGLNKTFQNKHNFSISYSRKIQRPALSNLVPSRQLMDPYTVNESNPLLKPSFANTIDMYYTIGGLSLYANYTHTRDMMSDVMFADLETQIYTQSMGNLRSVHDAYVGANWSQEFTKWWQGNSSLTIYGTQTRSEVANVPDVRLNGMGFNLYSTHIFSMSKGYKAELFAAYNSAGRNTIWYYRPVYWINVGLAKTVLKDGTLKVTFQDIFRTQRTSLSTKYGPVDIFSSYYSDKQRIRVSFSYNFGKKTVKQAKYKSMGNEVEKGRMGTN